MPTTSMPNGPSKPYRNATSDNAADFLDKVTAEMPWPVKAIQIAGGSEFMGEFELACAAKPIPLYLLPPRSPKLNRAVERCNGAWRYEFYAVVDLPHDIDKIAEHVDAFQQPAGAESLGELGDRQAGFARGHDLAGSGGIGQRRRHAAHCDDLKHPEGRQEARQARSGPRG